MNKLFRYMMTAAMALVALGCQIEEKVQIDPDMVIDPVLHDPGFPKAPETISITASNQAEEVLFTWDAADLGFGAQLNYAVEMFVEEGKFAAISGGVATTTTRVKYEDINYSLVYGLGAAPGDTVKVNFCLSASVGVRKFYSAPWEVLVVPTNAQKQYPHIYFVGSYCNWNHAAAQLLYDLSENGLKYQGVIDQGENFVSAADGGFKLTPEGNWNGEWGDPERWSNDDYENLPQNPEEVPMVTTGGGDCMRFRSNRYYHFTLAKETALLTMDMAFDSVKVSINEVEKKMAFHAVKHGQFFYADVAVAEGDKFKVNVYRNDEVIAEFKADEAMTPGLLVEAAMVDNAQDVTVDAAAGNYRLYVNMNDWDAVTYEFNEGMAGVEEGAGAAAELYKGWGICGSMNNWEGDIPMEFDGECWWVAKGVELEYDSDFIIRKDGASATVFGGRFLINEATYLTHDAGDVVVTAYTDKYDIYFNPTNGCCWFIEDGSKPTSGATVARPEGMSDWSICGTMTDWSDEGDFWMERYDADWFKSAEPVTFGADDEFKFRNLLRWEAGNKTFTSTALIAGRTYPLVDGSTNGGNIKVDAPGEYDIFMSVDTKLVCIMAPGGNPNEAQSYLPEKPADAADWSISGTFVGWNDWWMIEEGDFYVAKNVKLSIDDRFKFRHKSGWNLERGGSAIADPDCWYTVTSGGSDVKVGKNGIYDIYLNKALDTFYMMRAGVDVSQAVDGMVFVSPWAVSGTFNDWECLWMRKEGPYHVAKGVSLVKGDEFKLRKGEDWSDTRTAVKTVSPDTRYAVLSNGGADKNTIVGETGIYDIYLTSDFSIMCFMKEGTDPSEGTGEELPQTVTVTVMAYVGYDYLYGWWSDGSLLTSEWAGERYVRTKEIEGIEYKVWELTADKKNFDESKASFIFSNDGGQTSDSEQMTLDYEMKLTVINGKPVLQTEENKPVLVSIYAAVGSEFTHLYAYAGSTYAFGAWPGITGETVSETIGGKTYTMKWTKVMTQGESANVIINNGSNARQLEADHRFLFDTQMLISERDNKLVWDNKPDESETTDVTLYFDMSGWDGKNYQNLFVWNDKNVLTGLPDEWPGLKGGYKDVTENGKTYRTWTLKGVSKNGIRFKEVKYVLNGSAGQTEDSEAVILYDGIRLSTPAHK